MPTIAACIIPLYIISYLFCIHANVIISVDVFCVSPAQGVVVKTDYIPLLQSLAPYGWRLMCVLPTPIVRTNRYRTTLRCQSFNHKNTSLLNMSFSFSVTSKKHHLELKKADCCFANFQIFIPRRRLSFFGGRRGGRIRTDSVAWIHRTDGSRSDKSQSYAHLNMKRLLKSVGAGNKNTVTEMLLSCNLSLYKPQ